MTTAKPMLKLAVAALLAGSLSACALFEPCTTAACKEDASLESTLASRIYAQPSLATDRIYVQVVNRVAYLNGLVDTDVERLIAADIAGKVPGLTAVVNKIEVMRNWY